jgi:adenine-specific DNA-methyltransferase
MEKDKIFKKTLLKVLKTIISQLKEDDVEGYIDNIKGILYYTGKITLSYFYLLNGTISNENYDRIINSNSTENLPEIFHDMEECYKEKIDAFSKYKENIINVVENLTTKDLTEFSLGEFYELLITSKERKYLGQVYTPYSIVKYMVHSGITENDIINNPYFKIIDPACGGGYFLIESYLRIKDIIKRNFNTIISTHPAVRMEFDKGLDEFIIRNNLWGVDIDRFAVFMTTVSLLLKSKGRSNLLPNVFQKDVLLQEDFLEQLDNNSNGERGKFQLVIGNPPYIGHKKIDKAYRKDIEEKYREVYSDKADISYCFFKRGLELLSKKGRLIFITSRYFQESQSALKLRDFIKKSFRIETLVDFYGARVFKGANISPVIINCSKDETKDNIIHIYRLKDGVNITANSFNIKDNVQFNSFSMKQSGLESKGWILLGEKERELFNKIDSKGEYYLYEICKSNQGIITGYDKAFIVDKNDIVKEDLERDILKPWVKNSDIDKFRILPTDKYILYTDKIEEINDYKNTINHIKPYKDRLQRRRECLNGVRKWYQLQWGREINIFERPKILFPFKAERNKFVIDYDNALCSADIYIINIEEKYKDVIDLEYLAGFLNSSLFEFYFKCVAKKVGNRLYEYYPNKLMSMKIKIGEDKSLLNEKVRKVHYYYKILENNVIKKDEKELLEYINNEINKINKYFYKLYDLNKNEINIIESM